MSCPRCHSIEIRQSRRKRLVDPLFLLLFRMKPCRCLDCRKRFFMPSDYAKALHRWRPYAMEEHRTPAAEQMLVLEPVSTVSQ